MKRTTSLAAAAALAATILTPAVALGHGPFGPGGGQFTQHFERMDADKDGAVSADEF